MSAQETTVATERAQRLLGHFSFLLPGAQGALTAGERVALTLMLAPVVLLLPPFLAHIQQLPSYRLTMGLDPVGPLMVVTAAILTQLATPEYWSTSIKRLSSVACLFFLPWPATGYFLAAALSAVLLAQLTTTRLRVLCLPGVLFMPTLLSQRLGGEYVAAFGALLGVRLLILVWEQSQNEDARLKPGELWDYIFFAPFLVFPTAMYLIPFYSTFSRRVHPRPDRAAAGRALRLMILLTAAGLLRLQLNAWSQNPPWNLAVVMERGMFRILNVIIGGCLVEFLSLLFGLRERPLIVAPWKSITYLDLWQRFLIHQKDFLVALIYAPALVQWRKANRYVATVGALAATLLLASPVLHLIYWNTVFARSSVAEMLPRLVLSNVTVFGALAVLLCLQEWRRRHGQHPSPSRLRRASSWALTMFLWVFGMGLNA